MSERSERSGGGSKSAEPGPDQGSGRRAPRVPFALLVTGLIVGGLALLLALNTASAANELRRHGLADQDAGIAAEVQELRNEVAASAAPANLAAAATQLGMVPAGNPAFFVIGSDGVVRLLGKPAPVTAAPLPVPAASHKPKPKKSPSKKPTSSKTAKSTAHSTKSAKKSASKSAKKSPSKHPKTSTKPTPTPTPTLTLPGGTR